MAASLRDRLRAWASLLARPRSPETLPVSFDHRRVYVLPTRFGLFFATLSLAMLLGALNYNNNPALLLALLLAATGLASLIVAHLQLSGLGVDSVSAEPVAAGARIGMHVSLAATDARIRRGLQLHCEGADASASVMADGSSVALLWLPTAHRGWLDIGRIRISSTQPLGLARAWSWVWPDMPLLVYPSAEPQGPPLPQDEGGASRTRLHPAGDEVHQLRTYRPGDPRRAIAWKPSARRDVLMVREYEQSVAAEVILDWRSLPSLAHEHRIRRLAHWVELAEREGLRYRLILPAQPTLGPGQGATHRHLCLRALALLPHG